MIDYFELVEVHVHVYISKTALTAQLVTKRATLK